MAGVYRSNDCGLARAQGVEELFEVRGEPMDVEAVLGLWQGRVPKQ